MYVAGEMRRRTTQPDTVLPDGCREDGRIETMPGMVCRTWGRRAGKQHGVCRLWGTLIDEGLRVAEQQRFYARKMVALIGRRFGRGGGGLRRVYRHLCAGSRERQATKRLFQDERPGTLSEKKTEELRRRYIGCDLGVRVKRICRAVIR